MKLELIFFDALNENTYVQSKERTNKILSEFETISKGDLPAEFKKTTKINKPEYYRISPDLYYIINKKDLYRKIAGNCRIKDFFSVDDGIANKYYWSKEQLYWGIKKEIVFELIDFINLLDSKGYKKDGFRVRDGYRHPHFNEEVKGAKRSRHVYGDALDIIIGDIDGDGVADKKDKMIALEFCEEQLIRNRGGVGKYPNTQVIHIDLRGKMARWDSR